MRKIALGTLLALALQGGCAHVPIDWKTEFGMPVTNKSGYDIDPVHVDLAFDILAAILLEEGFAYDDIFAPKVHGYDTRIIFKDGGLKCYVRNPNTDKFEERDCVGLYYRKEMLVSIMDELDSQCLHRTALQHELLHYFIDKRRDVQSPQVEAGDSNHALSLWDEFGALWRAKWALCESTCPEECETYRKSWEQRGPENGGTIQ